MMGSDISHQLKANSSKLKNEEEVAQVEGGANEHESSDSLGDPAGSGGCSRLEVGGESLAIPA
jgi:hypothetical protein